MTTPPPPDPRRPFGLRLLRKALARDPRGRPQRFVCSTPDGLVDVVGEMLRTDRTHLYRNAIAHAQEIIAATGSGYALTPQERRAWLRASTHSLVDGGQTAQGPTADLIIRMMRQPRRTRVVILGAIVAHVAAVLRECNTRRAREKLLGSSKPGVLLDRFAHTGAHKGPHGVWRGR